MTYCKRIFLTACLLMILLNGVDCVKNLTKTFGTNHTVEFSQKDGDTLCFLVTMPQSSYLGLGFGPPGTGMVNTNIMLWLAAGPDSNTSSIFTTHKGRPSALPTSSPTLTTEILQNDDDTVVFYTERKFNTGGENEPTITEGEKIEMFYAFSTANSTYIAYHGKGNGRGYFAIRVNAFGDVISADGEGFDFFKFHGWMMWVAWGVFALIQISSNRYLKVYWKYSMWIHRAGGTLILLITLIIGGIAINKLGGEIELGWHTTLGFIVFLLVTLLALGGITVRILMRRLTWRTSTALMAKMGHKIFAYFLICFAQVTIVTGGNYYSTFNGGASVNPLTISFFIFFFILLIVFEYIHYRYRNKENALPEPDQTLTVHEFKERIKKGEELVILDDLVIDISKFKNEHPGGLFQLRHNVGRDISKFFYGGYSLEVANKIKPHYHSNVARSIIADLAIARLSDKAKIISVRIHQQYDINKLAKTITFKGDDKDSGFTVPDSTDVSLFGKHFLLRSYFIPAVKRQYTLTSCMVQETYQEYMKAINAFRHGEEINFDQNVLVENTIYKGLEFTFTCKNYNTLGGLSKRLHSNQDDLFQVKGLLGKGLGIQEEGTHIAFVAGTGVLVFLDLVAYLIRLNLDLLRNPKTLLSKEKFRLVLYCSFANKEEAFGLGLLEGLSDITKRKGLQNYELVLRLGNANNFKWDQDYIKRQIQINSEKDIRKIWVCGPPPMNELFDKTLEVVAPEFSLSKEQWEIL